MMVKALFVRTNYDRQTEYLFYWSEEILIEAQNRGVEVIKADGVKATQKIIHSYLKKIHLEFVCLNGHGTADTFYGHKNEEVITVNSAEKLKGTITFARACDCAATLGEEAVNKGCKAFIGYSKQFWVSNLNYTMSRILEDPLAKPVFVASNAIVMNLLKGNSVKESIDASHKAAAKEIVKLLYSNDLYSSAVLQALIVNDEALKYSGDASASLTI